jgi:hypothetical protein
MHLGVKEKALLVKNTINQPIHKTREGTVKRRTRKNAVHFNSRCGRRLGEQCAQF